MRTLSHGLVASLWIAGQLAVVSHPAAAEGRRGREEQRQQRRARRRRSRPLAYQLGRLVPAVALEHDRRRLQQKHRELEMVFQRKLWQSALDTKRPTALVTGASLLLMLGAAVHAGATGGPPPVGATLIGTLGALLHPAVGYREARDAVIKAAGMSGKLDPDSPSFDYYIQHLAPPAHERQTID